MKTKKVSRRQWLKGSSQLVSALVAREPLFALIDAIGRGSVNQAIASEMGVTPRKWIDMRFDGAPPRWAYDLFLQTNDDDKNRFVGNNPQMITRFQEENGRYVRGTYATTKIGNLHAPYLWQFNVPAAGGGTRPMAELLSSFLNIRGIDTSNPGHVGSRIFHYAPTGASKSIAALSADASAAPIGSVFYRVNNFTFRSQAAKTAQEVAGGNLAGSLLDAFRAKSDVKLLKEKEQLVKNYLGNMRVALSEQAVQRHPDSIMAKRALEGARELMMKDFGNLDVTWASLKAKYSSLVSRAIRGTYEGINDKPVGTAGARNGQYQMGGEGEILKAKDLRDLINESTDLPAMVDSFALAEFVILNKLSDSVTLGMGTFTGLKDANVAVQHSTDEHFTGAIPSLLFNSLFALAHAACLLELIDRIKAANLWSETVINCSGEFNRNPLNTGTGSNHGYQGASMALYSGAISGPLILGNIAANATPDDSRGTWGHGARLEEFKSGLEMGHAINTVAMMLRMPSVVAARPSLVTANGATIAAAVSQGKII